MKQKRFTEEQIAFALRQAESGTAVAEITLNYLTVLVRLAVDRQTVLAVAQAAMGFGVDRKTSMVPETFFLLSCPVNTALRFRADPS